MKPFSKKYHIIQTIKLSIPLIVSQLAVMLIGVVDTKMSGMLGAVSLAAVSIGGALWAVGVMLVMGVLMAAPPMISELDGSSKRSKIGPLVRQLIWLAVITGGLFFLIIRNLPPLFQLFGTQPEVIPLATEYLQALSWGMLSFPLFLVFRYVADGLSYTRMTMYVSFLGLALNVPFNYILMFGKLGFPALGVRGCGYASALVITIQTLVFGLIMAKHKWFKNLNIFEFFEALKWSEIKKVLVIGVPIGIALFAEGGFFSLVTMLASRLSPEVIAAHQISLNFSSLLFMIPLGISMAITIRVGNALGRGSRVDIRRAGLIGVLVVLVIQAVVATMILIFPDSIIKFYIEDQEVHQIALQLLFFAAIFQISDGIQVAAAGALRGIQDTKFLMYSTTIAFWGFGVSASWWFCFVKNMGAAGLWTGMISSLTFAAVFNLNRFHKKSLN